MSAPILYLITGFLGAGKTSFLHEFLRHGGTDSARVIVNEFGKVGVDGQLLSDSGAELMEITGGSIFCSCRIDQFENALDKALQTSPGRIIVEASGLSDPTSIRKILFGERYVGGITYGGCVCIADAVSLPKVYSTARVCKRQLSVCDAVLLNKIDIATPEQLQASRDIIQSQRPDAQLTETSFGRVPEGWLDAFHPLSGHEEGGIKSQDINLRSLNITVSGDMPPGDLTKFLEMFAEDTYRIKGFVGLSGSTYFVDCVGSLVRISPYDGAANNVLTVLYGYGLPAKKSATEAAKWYPGMVQIDK